MLLALFLSLTFIWKPSCFFSLLYLSYSILILLLEISSQCGPFLERSLDQMTRKLLLLQILPWAPCTHDTLNWPKPLWFQKLFSDWLSVISSKQLLAILDLSCSQICKTACCFPHLSLVQVLTLCRSCGCSCFVLAHLHFGVGGEYLIKNFVAYILGLMNFPCCSS